MTPLYNETRKGLYLLVNGKQEFTPEELTAMVLHYAEEITHHYGKEKGHVLGAISDCVLTIPSFATQAEREALLDAAKLAGFNVLSLIDENTASALNFGMDKTFEEPQIYLFYNLGASSLQVSVVKFHSYEVPESKYSKKMKRFGSIEVLGKGWDVTLGGLAFDNRLVEYMADHFNREWRHAQGHEKDVRSIPRAMTKIRLQANKVKQVLSANSEIPVHMDSLHDDMALTMHISRSQFEELCDDLMERAVAPVHAALASANLTLEDVTAIELIGGGMRVPKVQAGLSSVLGDKELGMHINSDESMALGAAFFGANLSTAFRVRQVGLVDINPFAIEVSLENLDATKSESTDAEPWSKKATIFKANSKIGMKKTIAFTHDKDVHCALNYADPETLPSGSQAELQRYKISGISEFAKEMEEKGLGKPKVSCQFELSLSGITALVKAEAVVEETYRVEVEEEVDDDEEVTGNGNQTATESEESKKEETPQTEDVASEGEAQEEKVTKESDAKNKTENVGNATDDKGTDGKMKSEEKPKKKKKTRLVEKVRFDAWKMPAIILIISLPTHSSMKIFGLRTPPKSAFVTTIQEKKRVHRKSLIVEKYYVGKVQPLSDVLVQEYKDNLAELANRDKERIALEEAKNKLESYIYLINNKLIDDDENIAKVSTEEQREELSTLSREAEDWLFDEGDSASLESLKSRLDVLMTPAEKVWFRLKESVERPAAVKALREKLTSIEENFNKWVAEMTHITEEEKSDVFENVFEKIESARKWLSDKEGEQAEKAPHEDPAFTSDEVPLLTQPIQKLVGRLAKKPMPKVKKNETEEKVAEEGGNETKAANSTDKSDASKNDGDDKDKDKEEEEEKGDETPINDDEL
jgi:hypoxia up-regulated 1